jgi:hypothetical protein
MLRLLCAGLAANSGGRHADGRQVLTRADTLHTNMVLQDTECKTFDAPKVFLNDIRF